MLDLTQEELAQQLGCAVITIRKLEMDERRPSKAFARRLAVSLEIAPEEYAKFIQFARARPHLDLVTPPADLPQPLPGSQPTVEKLGVTGHQPTSLTFCLTDLAEYLQLMDKYGEALVSALQQHDQLIEAAVYRHKGRILEKAGDSCLIVFEHTHSLACALEIQQRFAQQTWGEVGRLRLKIGLHYVQADQEGQDFFRRGNEYFGPAIIQTARIGNLAEGDQIAASTSVVENCPLPPDTAWQDLGLHQLKRGADPERVYGLKQL
jgi:class 3 adenylate cyclase